MRDSILFLTCGYLQVFQARETLEDPLWQGGEGTVEGQLPFTRGRATSGAETITLAANHLLPYKATDEAW